MIFKPIIIILVIIASLALVITCKNNVNNVMSDDSYNEEGFRSKKLDKFKNIKKGKGNLMKGSMIDRIKQKEKMMNTSDSSISAFDDITNTVDHINEQAIAMMAGETQRSGSGLGYNFSLSPTHHSYMLVSAPKGNGVGLDAGSVYLLDLSLLGLHD